MNLNSAIPVRFSRDIADRLKAVSKNTGIPVAQLVRTATENYLDEIESSRAVKIELREAPVAPRAPKKQSSSIPPSAAAKLARRAGGEKG